MLWVLFRNLFDVASVFWLSSSSTQFSQEWVCRKVVVKHSIKSKLNINVMIPITLLFVWWLLWDPMNNCAEFGVNNSDIDHFTTNFIKHVIYDVMWRKNSICMSKWRQILNATFHIIKNKMQSTRSLRHPVQKLWQKQRFVLPWPSTYTRYISRQFIYHNRLSSYKVL